MELTRRTRMALTTVALGSMVSAATLIWLVVAHPLRLLALFW